jgi:hypothetical protein
MPTKPGIRILRKAKSISKPNKINPAKLTAIKKLLLKKFTLVGVVSFILRLYGELHPQDLFYYIENPRIIKPFVKIFAALEPVRPNYRTVQIQWSLRDFMTIIVMNIFSGLFNDHKPM